MAIRVLLAGLLAGLLVFVTGAIEHAVLGWSDRAMIALPAEKSFIEALKTHNLKPGMFSFPDKAEAGTAEGYEQLNEKYKAGPSGMLIIHPTGEDMMGPKELGSEFLTNVLAGLLAAWLVSHMAAGATFGQRWQVGPIVGLIAWLSIAASYGIWYRFPWEFVRDELLCVLVDWSIAGLAIAAIVQSPAKVKSAQSRGS